MCYLKPGPRCSASARARLTDAIRSGDALKIAKARQEYMLTPDGIEELRGKGRYETAEVMEAKRNELIAESKRGQIAAAAGREISAQCAEAYFEPNENEKMDIVEYFSRLRDRQEFIANNSELDEMLYDLNLYHAYAGGDERLENTDYAAEYDKALRKAERATMEGRPQHSEIIMRPWTSARQRIISDTLSRDAQVDASTTRQMVTDWETGNRSALQSAAVGAFGGQDTYQPNNPAHRVLAAQYHRTQAYLKSQNVDSIRVYRNSNEPTTSLNSCTMEEAVAKGRGNVYYADIPRESVVSLPQTGMGSVVNREVVIGPLSDTTWHSSQYEVDNPNGTPNGYHQ